MANLPRLAWDRRRAALSGERPPSARSRIASNVRRTPLLARRDRSGRSEFRPRCSSSCRARLRRNEWNAGEIARVSPGVAGEDAAAGDRGMGADEEIGEDVAAVSSRAPVFHEGPSREKQRRSWDLLEQKAHLPNDIIQCVDGFE